MVSPQSLWFLLVSPSLYGLLQSLWSPPVSMVSPSLYGLLQSLWSPLVYMVAPSLYGLPYSLWSPPVSMVSMTVVMSSGKSTNCQHQEPLPTPHECITPIHYKYVP